MRTIGLVICLLAAISGYSQRVYNSTHTIHMPSHITEDIIRTITFSKNNEYILIKSNVDQESVHLQLMVVKKCSEELFHDGIYQIFECVSADEIYPTRVLIRLNNPEYISVIQPSVIKKHGIETFHLKLEVLL
jgi:hypothetical protein